MIVQDIYLVYLLEWDSTYNKYNKSLIKIFEDKEDAKEYIDKQENKRFYRLELFHMELHSKYNLYEMGE